MHVIAAKAVAFKEALQPEFKIYQQQVLDNAKRLATQLQARGYDLVSDGTDNHLFLVNLIKHNITGKDADRALGAANITVNFNSVPNDPCSPMVTSGIRIGTPAVTTRGFQSSEIDHLAALISDVLDNSKDEKIIQKVKAKVIDLCQAFPVYTKNENLL